MKLLSKNQEALNNSCPYCHAKAGEKCKSIQGSVFTLDREPRDQWGRPQIHNARIKIKKDKAIMSRREKEQLEWQHYLHSDNHTNWKG